MKSQIIFWIVVFIILLLEYSYGAVYKPSSNGTNTFSTVSEWQTTSNWTRVSGSSAQDYPVSGDEIQFGNPGYQPTIVISFDLSSTYNALTFSSIGDGSELTVGSGGVVTATSINENNRSIITVNSGGQLSVQSLVTLNQNTTTINNDGTLNFNAGLTFDSGSEQILNNSNDVNITGDFDMEAGDLNLTGGDLSISGDWIIGTPNGNTYNELDISSGASMTIGGSVDLHNQALNGDNSKLNISNGTFTANGGCEDNGSGACQYISDNGGDLPVTLLFFEGEWTPKGFLLKWATSSEVNSDRFEIEASIDKMNWNTIGVRQSQGNSQTKTDYEYLVTNEQYCCFRLVSYDLDGSVEYFGEVNSSFTKEKSIKIYPTIFTNKEVCKLFVNNVDKNEKIYLELVGAQGKILFRKIIINSKNENEYYALEMPNSVNAGLYFLKVRVNNYSKIIKLIVNK